MEQVPIPTPDVRAAHARHRLLPWVGSGLSSAIAGQRLPDYEQLIRRIVEAALAETTVAPQIDTEIRQALVAKNFKHAAVLLRTALPERVFARIVRAIIIGGKPKASQHHVMLNLLGFRLFLTTNYDRVLDQIVKPQPEILGYRDHASVEAILDAELDAPASAAPIVLKLNGDISAPSTIVLGQSSALGLFDPDSDLGAGLRALLKRLLAEYSLLFLGYSFQDPDYRRLLIELGGELGDRRQNHVALIPEPELAQVPDQDLLTRCAGIALQPFPLDRNAADGDAFRALWQYLSQIAPGRPVDIRADARDGSFYLTEERPQYLRQQNDFERTAHAFRYITPTLSNAFSTQAYLDEVVPAQLAQFKPVVQDWASWSDEVLRAMTERLHTFEEKLHAGAEFRILCRLSNTRKDLQSGRRVIIDRYRYVLTLIENADLDVELRFSGPSDESRSLTSYACLIRGNETTSDIAVAYASQGTTAEYNAHVFEHNTAFARDLLVVFESEWARALPERESRAALRALLADNDA